MGALINKAESSLSTLIDQNGQGVAVDGLGRPLSSSVSVDVNALAAAQTLTSGSYPSTDKNVFGTGTLNVTVGSGSVVPVTITDGSLSGVAKSINDATAGIAATVVQNGDGSYSLQITGNKTGVGNGFSINGMNELVYDSGTGTGTLQATAKAKDASYTVNGVTHTSPTNDNVTVAPGVTATFTQTGAQTLASPIGQSNSMNSAETLVSDFNSLVSADPSASAGSSSGSTSITKVLDSIVNQNFGGTTLSALGITVAGDGTLSINQATFGSAFSANPNEVNAAIGQAAQAIKTALSTGDGVANQVKASVESLAVKLAQVPSLAQILAGNSSTASGSSSSSVASQMMSMMSA